MRPRYGFLGLTRGSLDPPFTSGMKNSKASFGGRLQFVQNTYRLSRSAFTAAVVFSPPSAAG